MANERETTHREQRLNTQALHFLLRGKADQFAKLRQQNPDWKPEFVDCVLSGCTLSAFDLSNCRFRDTVFGDTVCQSTDFSGSEFYGCRFEATDLVEASFEGANIIRCLFRQAQLEGTTFECAYLMQTDILLPTFPERTKHDHPRGPNLSRARIVGCRLSQKLLRIGTILEYTVFSSYEPSNEDDEDYEVRWDVRRCRDTYIDVGDEEGDRSTRRVYIDRPLFTAKTEKDTDRAIVAAAFAKASWNTLSFDAKLQRRADLLPDSRNVDIPEFAEHPSRPKLSIPKEAALRMASEAFLKESTNLILDGVNLLPIADETRQKLAIFFRDSKGQLLIAHLISFVLESGLIDHLPLLTDGMKDVLRKHLPEELRVSTFAKGFEELANVIGAHLSRLLREASLGTEAAEPAVSPPAPAALPEPAAKDPAPEPQRQKARVPRR